MLSALCPDGLARLYKCGEITIGRRVPRHLRHPGHV